MNAFHSIKYTRVTNLLFVLFVSIGALAILVFPMVALSSTVPDTANNTSSFPDDRCFAQIASNPTITYTSQDASAIRLAITMANNDDFIKVAGYCQGVVMQAGTPQVIYINKNLSLQGGYTTSNWITPSLTSLAVIDADYSGRAVVLNGSSSITLTNMEIIHGDATGLGGGPFGGFDAGGGVYIPSAAFVTLDNVRILSNNGSLGGGIYNLDGTVSIQNSEVSRNFGRPDNSNLGGAIYNHDNGRIVIDNGLLQFNALTNTVGSAGGAGIYNRGHITITRLTAKNNITNWDQGNGGGINNQAGVIVIDESTFAYNESPIGGGIINYSIITITNSTISHNSSYHGAGVFNSGGGLLWVRNSSILSNTTSIVEFGASLQTGWNGQTYVTNSIIGYEQLSRNCATHPDGTLTSYGYNLDSDGTCVQHGSNNDIVAADLGVSALNNHGGQTDTHALLENSPAINSGNCSNDTVLYDQRNVLRPQSSACDIGAFEVQSFSNLTATESAYYIELGTSTTFTATIDEGDFAVSFSWDFGDGSTASGAIVTHTYSTAEAYSVTVTAHTAIQTETVALTVQVIEPFYNLTATVNADNIGLGSMSIFTASVEGGSDDVIFSWDFGDGATADGAIITHTYSATGIYVATVTASTPIQVETKALNIQVINQVFLPLVTKSAP